MPSANFKHIASTFFVCTPIIAYLQRVIQTNYKGGNTYEY